MELTKEKLEELGIFFTGSKLYPRRFSIPYINVERNIPENAKMDYIFNMIYNEGFDVGVKQGEENKISEIKKVLNIEEHGR